MNLYLVIIVAAMLGNYLLGLVADMLNVRHISTVLPAEFEGHFDAEKYRTSQRYLRDSTRFSIVGDTFFTILTLVFMLAGGFDWVDGMARHFGLGPILTGLLFGGLLLLLSQLLHIPFSAYSTFAIEERYGFNRTTAKTFALDIVKEWIIGGVIAGVLFAAVLWLFGAMGAMAWLYCWGVVTVLQVFLMFIAPVVIMPLFNKFTPLAEGELRKAIEDYARSQEFKMKGVFTMDGSKRSTKSNAFFTGFGRFRRIVLFDTLIARHTVGELVSVLAHEIGHYRRHHLLKLIAISVLTNGLTLFLLSFFINNRGLFDAFRMGHVSIYGSLIFAGFLYSPLALVLSIAANALSRRYEYDADAYAVATCGDAESFIAALKKLTVDNLGNLSPHPVKVFLSYSHPPVLERIHAIREQARK